MDVQNHVCVTQSIDFQKIQGDSPHQASRGVVLMAQAGWFQCAFAPLPRTDQTIPGGRRSQNADGRTISSEDATGL